MSTPDQGTEPWFPESRVYTLITRTTFLSYVFAFICITEGGPRNWYSSFAQSQDDKMLFLLYIEQFFVGKSESTIMR